MKVVIIGTGNVAYVLAKLIHKAGHEIVKILGREAAHAKTLAANFNCEWGELYKDENGEADIYLLAITDTGLTHLEKDFNTGTKITIHTAGSVAMNVLKDTSPNYGVLYPLQSLSKITSDIPVIPMLIDGNNMETKSKISEFANTISADVSFADDDQRLKFHIAAVMVSNFTNHLFAMTDNFCQAENIDFKKLYPLIEETFKRIKNNTPVSVQTGPAVRDDIYTLGKHLQMLTSHPDYKYLYLKLSESIQKLHKKEN